MSQEFISFNESISFKLLKNSEKYSDKNALKVNGNFFSYEELFDFSKKIAMALKNIESCYCLIMTKRNFIAYAGMLGVLLAGKSYVFLNYKENLDKLAQSISQITPILIITDKYCLDFVRKLSIFMGGTIDFLLIEEEQTMTYYSNFIQKKISEKTYQIPLRSNKIAYMMFTSGSTGVPKGVPISHNNLNTFIDNIVERIKPTENDHFSQLNELTFDFSVYEIFTCWRVGACLYIIPESYILGIPKFIQDNKITYWASVPSIVNLLKKLNKLPDNGFHSIRYTIFCGEPLSSNTANLWAKAAPLSQIDNLYGPTEATVAITGFLWNKNEQNPIISIGFPFLNQEVLLLNEALEKVSDGEVGEIYLKGSQVACEYWKNEILSKKHFIHFNGHLIYKTGDLASLDKQKGFLYKGRADDQLKIRGYRVEKIEIESTIKKLTQANEVAVVAIKNIEELQEISLYCFISGTSLPINKIMKLCRKNMPDYMLPTEIIKLESFPYNKNGKIDYQSLKVLCNE